MPLWIYGYLICSCLYAFWHGGRNIKNRKSSLFSRLKPNQAVLVGWLEITVNAIVLVFVICGIALHVTYA